MINSATIIYQFQVIAYNYELRIIFKEEITGKVFEQISSNRLEASYRINSRWRNNFLENFQTVNYLVLEAIRWIP